jgi:hypothetical protein
MAGLIQNNTQLILTIKMVFYRESGLLSLQWSSRTRGVLKCPFAQSRFAMLERRSAAHSGIQSQSPPINGDITESAPFD